MFEKRRKKRLNKEADNLVRLANKVLAYRKDLFTAEVIEAITAARDKLASAIAHSGINQRKPVDLAMHELDRLLSKHGGDIYPVTFWSENCEMLLVAAILAIGIRSFFFQPFKIPTNSMYPTYAGMTPYVYNIDSGGPSLPEKLFRFAAFGAEHYEQEAPKSGEVYVPIQVVSSASGRKAVIPSETFTGRKWFGLLPAQKRRYILLVNSAAIPVNVPVDFQIEEIVRQSYFPQYETLLDAYEAYAQKGQVLTDPEGAQAIATGVKRSAGETVLDFDILSGDMLFVDRISYHFVRPEVGDPFVFRTGEIPGLRNIQTGLPTDEYYIKRLVGEGGDTLQVKAPILYRNGEPITGAPAFQDNAQRKGEYPGYDAIWRLSPGDTETVPDGFYYAMGDNSPESYDSRGWGLALERFNPRALSGAKDVNFVPEKQLVGKAAFIFYPFTHRWGVAE